MLYVLFGDYSILILILLMVYSTFTLILNHKFNFHHVYFLGLIFIYLGLSMLSHLNIYDNMEDSNILSFNFSLYKNYFKSYSYSYSTGGVVVGTLLSLAASFIAGRVGIILVGTCFIIVGIDYLLDVKIIKILKGGKIRTELKQVFMKGSDFFSNIKTPTKKIVSLKPSILQDSLEEPSFTLQEEINKEMLIDLKEYIKNNKLYCVCDSFYTSYTSSRFVINLAHKSDELIKEIKKFFNRR